MERLREGSPAIYVPTLPNDTDELIITVGKRPLLLGRPYSHRGDDNHRGLFSCGFSPRWKNGVSSAMLWRIEYADGGFYIKNAGTDEYLSAEGEIVEDEEKVSLSFGEKTEFHLTNEGFIAFYTASGEFYLSYHHSRGFIAPSAWTSSMTDMSDAEFFAATSPCGKAALSFDSNSVTVYSGKRPLASGDEVEFGTSVSVKGKYDDIAGWRANGYAVRAGGEYTVYRDTVIKPIVKRHDGGKYLSFISDVHDLPHRLDKWLFSLPFELERCVFGGDITAGNVKSIAAQQAAHDAACDIVARYTKKPSIVTIGNHEYEYSYRWGEREISEIFTDTLAFGGIIEAEYAIYNFGASEFDHDDFQSNFPDGRIKELRDFLKTVPSGIPVFVNAHYPLHAVKRRPSPCGAEKMIALLSEYKNAVYLWGHNHGQRAEDGYGRILTVGDEILYNYDEGKKATLGFTYASHGAMYDAARTVAPYYGLTARLTKGKTELTYYDLSGAPVPYKTAAGAGESVTFTLWHK